MNENSAIAVIAGAWAVVQVTRLTLAHRTAARKAARTTPAKETPDDTPR